MLMWEKRGAFVLTGKQGWMTYTLYREPHRQTWNIIKGGITSTDKIGVASTIKYAKEMAQDDADERAALLESDYSVQGIK